MHVYESARPPLVVGERVWVFRPMANARNNVKEQELAGTHKYIKNGAHVLSRDTPWFTALLAEVARVYQADCCASYNTRYYRLTACGIAIPEPEVDPQQLTRQLTCCDDAWYSGRWILPESEVQWDR